MERGALSVVNQDTVIMAYPPKMWKSCGKCGKSGCVLSVAACPDSGHFSGAGGPELVRGGWDVEFINEIVEARSADAQGLRGRFLVPAMSGQHIVYMMALDV